MFNKLSKNKSYKISKQIKEDLNEEYKNMIHSQKLKIIKLQDENYKLGERCFKLEQEKDILKGKLSELKNKDIHNNDNISALKNEIFRERQYDL